MIRPVFLIALSGAQHTRQDLAATMLADMCRPYLDVLPLPILQAQHYYRQPLDLSQTRPLLVLALELQWASQADWVRSRGGQIIRLSPPSTDLPAPTRPLFDAGPDWHPDADIALTDSTGQLRQGLCRALLQLGLLQRVQAEQQELQRRAVA